MNESIERAVLLGRYMVETGDTVRGTAAKFGISKSTVHKDVTVRLRQISPQLYKLTAQVLDVNKRERHLRGGQATKEKYERKRQERR